MNPKPSNLAPLALLSAKATRSALLIDDSATDAELTTLGQQLARIEGSRSWWLGDYGIALQRRKRAALMAGEKEPEHKSEADRLTWQEAQAERLNAKGAHYMHERAESLGVEEGTWKQYVMVARYFEPSVRLDALTFGHHAAALQAVGVDAPVDFALAWLRKAALHDWSVSELRRHAREAGATALPPSGEPEANPFALIDEADRWAIHAPADIAPAQAALLLTRWHALTAFIERLQDIAARERP